MYLSEEVTTIPKDKMLNRQCMKLQIKIGFGQ